MSEKGSRGINQPLNEGLASELTLARELKALTMLHKLAMFSVGEAGLEPVLGEIVDVAIASAQSSWVRNLRTLKFELIAVFRNGGLTSGTELIRVKAPAAQRSGGGNALSLSMLNRARFFEGPLLSKCRVGQAYERFSPPPSFPLRENP
jgi:hypothetical protein